MTSIFANFKRIRSIALMACLCASFPLSAARAADTTIFAAASLKTALDEVAAVFDAQTGQTTAISYAGTSVLARQISQGAPADIVIAASTEWMDWLATQNAIAPNSRFDLLSNQLVLIQHGDAAPIVSTTSLLDRLQNHRIALALVAAVPAGIYGKSALETLGVWDVLEPQIAQTDNVRAALALVASGEAPFGIVYATDALADPRVSVIATFAPDSHAKILYPTAIIAERASQSTQQFIDHLRSDTATAIFEAHGFTDPDPAK